MNWVRTTIAIALAAFWPVAASHCLLEQVTDLGFLSCCSHEETKASHENNDCHQDGCAQVESGLYKSEFAPLSAPTPNYTLVSLLLPTSLDLTLDNPSHLIVPAASPPELPVSWQFSHRTAASPRAPSFVS